MTVLERSELEASTLADLHTIANQIGVDGFRRLRKAELIDAILNVEAESGGADADEVGAPDERPLDEQPLDEQPFAAGHDGAPSLEDLHGDAAAGIVSDEAPPAEEAGAPVRKRRFGRLRRVREESTEEAEERPSEIADGAREAPGEAGEAAGAESSAGEPAGLRKRAGSGEPAAVRKRAGSGEPDSPAADLATAAQLGEAETRSKAERAADLVEGTVELLSNGSAFLRIDPSGSSDRDVYVSAAQVRRCELVAGDRVAGPVRLPRRSERHPSLVRVETINGIPATEIAVGPRYEELTAVFPEQRLPLDAQDATLRAIDSLAPIGLGSRVVICGPARVGKTETLRRLIGALAGRDGLELSLVLLGVRPEEAGEWRTGPLEPAAALSFAAPPETQGQALERAMDAAKRAAGRGGNALVAIDTLDGVPQAVARKTLAAARNLAEAGSLTVIATASAPLGGETTVIALDRKLAAAGRHPALDLLASGTLRAERLLGEEGARAIARARAAAAGI